MIGSAFKKLAVEYGMKVDRGVAYGSLQGYAATFCEGSGWKRIVFSTLFQDPAQKTMLLETVQTVDLRKEYRVTNFAVAPNGVLVEFQDNPGTMGKIRNFLAWFLPLLQQHQASLWNICPQCGCEVTAGKWMLVNGVASFMHDSCAQKAVRDVEGENERRKQEDNGSYLTGAIGAGVGALLGAVVWALVLMAGYVASIIGLLIGWMSNKGYDLLRGKKGKGKIAILIVSVILGVVLGTLGADVISLAQYMGTPEMEGFTVTDIPVMLMVLFLEDPEYRRITLGNIGMGLVFAALGVYWLVIRTSKEVADEKIVELK